MVKLIPLTGKATGTFTKVSDEDYDEVSKYKWHTENGYPSTIFKDKIIKHYKWIQTIK